VSIDNFLQKATKADKKPHWCVEHQKWETEAHDEKALEKDWNPVKGIVGGIRSGVGKYIEGVKAGNTQRQGWADKLENWAAKQGQPKPPDEPFVPKQQETEGEKMDRTITERRNPKNIEQSLLKVMERPDEEDDPYGHKEARRNPASIAQRWEGEAALARMKETGETGGTDVLGPIGRDAPPGFEDEAARQKQEEMSGIQIRSKPGGRGQNVVPPTGNRLNAIENALLKLMKADEDDVERMHLEGTKVPHSDEAMKDYMKNHYAGGTDSPVNHFRALNHLANGKYKVEPRDHDEGDSTPFHKIPHMTFPEFQDEFLTDDEGGPQAGKHGYSYEQSMPEKPSAKPNLLNPELQGPGGNIHRYGQLSSQEGRGGAMRPEDAQIHSQVVQHEHNQQHLFESHQTLAQSHGSDIPKSDVENALLKLMKQGRTEEIPGRSPLGPTHLTGPMMHPEDKTRISEEAGHQASFSGGTMDAQPGGGRLEPVSRTQAMELPTQQEQEAWADKNAMKYDSHGHLPPEDEAVIRAQGGAAWKPQVYQNSVQNSLLKLMKEEISSKVQNLGRDVKPWEPSKRDEKKIQIGEMTTHTPGVATTYPLEGETILPPGPNETKEDWIARTFPEKKSIQNSLLKIMKYGSSINPTEVGMTRKNATQDIGKAQGVPGFPRMAPASGPKAGDPEGKAEATETAGSGANPMMSGEYTALGSAHGVADALAGAIAGKKQPPGPSMEDIAEAAGRGAARAFPQQQQQQQESSETGTPPAASKTTLPLGVPDAPTPSSEGTNQSTIPKPNKLPVPGGTLTASMKKAFGIRSK